MRGKRRKLTELSIQALESWSNSEANSNKNAPFQVIDFFCGAGGMSLGFAAFGKVKKSFRIIGGCDINSDALKTFQRNFKAPGIQEDIRNLASDENLLKDFLTKLDGYDAKKPLIILGCAPCQGFTSHRKKNWDEEDERNSLISAFATVAVKLNPVCIVMENVPEMLSKKYWNYFLAAKKIFTTAGYTLNQNIHNAAAFGVPQERFRSLVVAMRKNFISPEPLLTSESFVTVRQAIGHLPPVEPGVAHPQDRLHRSAGHRASTIETIKAVPKDGGSRPSGVGPPCLDKVKGYYDVYGRLSWDKPSITITHYARNPASGRYVHPEQNRGLTIREAALLQSFPVGFEFEGSIDAIYKQIGEAVAPRFACAVAANIFVELQSSPPNEIEQANSAQSITTPVSSSYSSVIAGIKQKRRKNDLQLY